VGALAAGDGFSETESLAAAGRARAERKGKAKMGKLLETVTAYNAVKEEHVPDASRHADPDAARAAVNETTLAWTRLLAGTGVPVEETAEAVAVTVDSAIRGLCAAGHVRDQATLDLLVMVAQTMWMDGLAVGLRHRGAAG
jgi:hypothetical protein